MYKAIQIFLIFIAVLACAFYAALCVTALLYDAPLGICEDEIFAEINLLNNGERIYQQYGDGYVSLIYNPLYYYFSLPAFILKQSLTSIRIVSVLSIIAAFLAVYKILRLMKADRFAIIIALGFLACISPNTGGPWEQVKADGLMVALVLWAVYFLLRQGWSIPGAMASGILFALSFYAKQTALPFIIAGFISVVFIKKSNILHFFAGFFLVFILIGIALYVTNGYWYLFYTYIVPSRQTLSYSGIGDEIISIWLRKFPILILFSVAGIYLLGKSRIGEVKYILSFTYIAAMASYILPRCKYGGSIYNFLPYGILCCILFAVAIDMINKETGLKPGGESRTLGGPMILLLPIFLQFCLVAYLPQVMMPNKNNIIMRDKVVNFISGVDGAIYMPVQSYYAFLGGKEMYSSFITITDVLNSGMRESYPEDLVEKLDGGEIRYVLAPRMDRPMDALRGKLPPFIMERLIDRGLIVDPMKWEYNRNILYYPIQLFEITQPADSENTVE